MVAVDFQLLRYYQLIFKLQFTHLFNNPSCGSPKQREQHNNGVDTNRLRQSGHPMPKRFPVQRPGSFFAECANFNQEKFSYSANK